MQQIVMRADLTPQAMDLMAKLVEHGLTVEGYLDPNEHLTLKEAAVEARRKYTTFHKAIMEHGQDLLSRPFGPGGNARITRGNLWKFLSRSPKGAADVQES